MTFFDFLRQNWLELFALTREHLFLVFVSTFCAVVIGVPLGVLVTRVKFLQTPVLSVANVLQTIPSLALFGLLIPIAYIGGIGAKTAIIALTLYSFLPIIRNTVTGISNVDVKVREAAVAMGMTDFQVLRMVEIPLAMPVIITGIRVAVVIAVGVATVAAAVGAGGLGTYIFRGLRQNDNNLLLAGAVSSAILALFADFVLGQFAKLFAPSRKSGGFATSNTRRAFIAVGATSLLLIIVGVVYTQSGVVQTSNRNRVIVGSKDFTESVILSEILAQMLEKRGVVVTRNFELSGNLAHEALLSNELDVYPEYTGTAFTAILKHAPETDAQAVYQQVKREYADKFNLEISPSLGFSNDFAILIRRAEAEKLKLRTISDAVQYSRDWQAGFGQDFMSRADGYKGFAAAYNLQFAKQPREMDLSLTYRALAANQVDVIAGNSTDGLIEKLGLFQLQDDKHYFPPYQAVFIARLQSLQSNDVLKDVLVKLKDAISTDDMRRLNYKVDNDKVSPKDVAKEWLTSKQSNGQLTTNN